MNFLKSYYGSSEGPLGFPMQDRQAIVLDALLKSLPKEKAFEYRRLSADNLKISEVVTGERSDVSWITTEHPDRQNEVVIAKGMNESQFALNPLVTLNHCYHLPPVGKSLWRKRARDGDIAGIKAKTQYPVAPADWPSNDDWPPDKAFALVQSDLLRGKSIGFLPTAIHNPTEKEREKNGWKSVDLVIDEWILLEYACVFLPAQQNAVLESVSKSLLPESFTKALNLEVPKAQPQEARTIAFTNIDEVERLVASQIGKWNVDIDGHIKDALDRHRGKV